MNEATTAFGHPDSNRIIKVNHAGEFGTVNINRAQILFGRLFGRTYVPQLEELIEHEKVHLAVFGNLLALRGARRRQKLLVLRAGGYLLGLITSLLGRRRVMACTATVENVVLGHLYQQLEFLEGVDAEAHTAVASIIADEEAHRTVGEAEGGDNPWYKPVRFVVAMATEFVIWLGMTL